MIPGPDLLPMRIGHGAVALDVPDDAAGRVPNLDAPPVARIVNIPDFLPMRVHDVGARRGRGGRGSVLAITHDTTGGRWRGGNQHHDQGQRQDCELAHGRLYAGQDARLPRSFRSREELIQIRPAV